jgi:uncharacterized membrane protein
MSKETKEEPKKTEPTVNNTSSTKDIEENKAITFLSYLGILALVPLLAKQDSKFAQFHAKQGIVLFVCWFVASWIAGFIPMIGWFLIAPAVSILGIVLSIMGLMNVAKGENKELPIVGELVTKMKI